MLGIIDTTTTFIANKKKRHYYVKSAKFTELGWQVKLTRMPSDAKKYKTFLRAYNAARTMGHQFYVVEI